MPAAAHRDDWGAVTLTSDALVTVRASNWRELADEAAALELLEVQDRVRDVQNERDVYRMLSGSALEMIARLTQRNRQLAGRIDHLNGELKALLNAPCLECRRRSARRSDRAA